MKKIITIAFFSFLASQVVAQEGRNVDEYNLNKEGVGFINGGGLEALGFDPVSVFEEGGEESLIGSPKINLDYEGVKYLFSNKENREVFLTNPEKYEPTYGGWCARAMVEGQKIPINTKLFTVVGNRSFFFVSKRAKRFFDRDIEGNSIKADAHWKRISGESPRK